MKKMHIIKIKYVSPTNSAGSKVKIISEDYKESISIAYNYSFNSALDIAIDYLQNKGFEIIGTGNGRDEQYVISSTFKQLKGEKQWKQ